MKIIFLADEIPPESPGGAGFSTFILAKGLTQAGHDVLLVSGTNKKELHNRKININGVAVCHLFTKYNHKLKSIYSLYNPQVIFELKKIFNEFKPGIIHAHNIVNRISFYSLHLARQYSKAVFFTARDTMSFTYGKYWWFIDRKNKNLQNNFKYKIKTLDLIKQAKKSYLPFRNILIRRWLNDCDYIFSVSEELKKAMQANGFKRVKAIYNSINVNEYNNIIDKEIDNFRKKYLVQNKKVIFCAGRLNALKGLVQVLEVIKMSIKEDPAIVLALAMEKKYYENIKDLIARMQISNNVIFYGWLDEREMKIAIKASDICVTPSIYLDPFPRMNLEAMAAKKPVIGTCFGGTPEIIINSKNGYVVNPFNIENFAQRIIDLALNKKKAKQMGEVGYEQVKKNFNVNKQVAKIIEYYKKYGKYRNN